MSFVPAPALFCARLIQELYDNATPPNVVNPATDTQALVYRGERVYVIFPGTASLQDWRTDARIAKCNWLAGRVHVGFKSALESVMAGITDQLRAGDRIVVAGHSLGGALAMLCAHALARRGERVTAVHTFGQPRVGDWRFARDYNAMLHDETFRIVNAGDLVPRVPLVFCSYKHAGTEVYLQRGGGVTVDHPWWSDVQDVCGALRAPAASTPTPSASFNLPHHSLKTYITKLEALD